jgi:hypothetical protein
MNLTTLEEQARAMLIVGVPRVEVYASDILELCHELRELRKRLDQLSRKEED